MPRHNTKVYAPKQSSHPDIQKSKINLTTYCKYRKNL